MDFWEEAESKHLVCRASGQDELAVGVEGQAVDLSGVSVHRVTGLGGVVRASVPAVCTQYKRILDIKGHIKGMNTFITYRDSS